MDFNGETCRQQVTKTASVIPRNPELLRMEMHPGYSARRYPTRAWHNTINMSNTACELPLVCWQDRLLYLTDIGLVHLGPMRIHTFTMSSRLPEVRICGVSGGVGSGRLALPRPYSAEKSRQRQHQQQHVHHYQVRVTHTKPAKTSSKNVGRCQTAWTWKSYS